MAYRFQGLRGSEEIEMQTGEVQCRRFIGGAVAAVVICFLSASPGLAAGKGQFCASDRDMAALNARVLQTELMVAALSCGEKQRYNSFVNSYQKVLVDRSRAMQALFKRTHGARANTTMNVFITKLANDASQQARDRGDDYCVFAGELFDETFSTPPADLNKVTNKPWIRSRHGYPPCVQEANTGKRAG
jgi:hypothetical protein